MGACSFCTVECASAQAGSSSVCAGVKDANMCVSRAIAPMRDKEGMTAVAVAVVVGSNGYAQAPYETRGFSKRAGQSHEQYSRDARCEIVKVPNRLGREEIARLVIVGTDKRRSILFVLSSTSSLWKQTEESYVERKEKRSRTGRGRSDWIEGEWVGGTSKVQFTCKIRRGH